MTSGLIEAERRKAKRLLNFAIGAAVVAVVVGTVYYSLLLPIFVSAFLSYLLHPLVKRLERRGVRRTIAMPVMVAVTLSVLGVIGVQFAPVLYDQALALVRLIPPAISTLVETWLPLAEHYVAGLGFVSADELHQYISGISVMSRLESQLQAGLTGIWVTVARLAGGILNLILIPVLTFFFLKDARRLIAGFRKLIPRDLVIPVRDVARRLDQTLKTLIKGQVTVAGILALMYVVGLSVVGLRSAIAIGIVAGVCRVIPYLDVVVGAVLSTIVLLSDFHGWGQVLGVMSVFFVVQAIDGAFVTPSILGDRVGLHPMLVVGSVMAFGHWFGFWGVLLAVPLLAIIKVLLEIAAPYYYASRSYDPDR